MKLTLMTIEEYEMEFLPELEANWQPLLRWDEWVNRCYQSYLDSVSEQELNMELNQL